MDRRFSFSLDTPSPATMAMGATLPALEAILAPRIRTGSASGGFTQQTRLAL